MISAEQSPGRILEVQDWGSTPYTTALRRQRALVEERIAGRAPDRLVLVEHPPVVTLGRSGTDADLLVPEEALRAKGVGVCRVERGGKATFHGPGQLVAYPIVEIRERDIGIFLSGLLSAVAGVLEGYGLRPEQVPGRPGLWVDGAKIASVGLAVRRWVTFHGIALNVRVDPSWFSMIVPCGQPAERIISMEQVLGRPVRMDELRRRFIRAFAERFGYREVWEGPPGFSVRPGWLRPSRFSTRAVTCMEERLRGWSLATVCQGAHCPNLGECFSRGTATFMILGTVCTRGCRFCAVRKGAPRPLDPGEPERVARAAASLGLGYVVVTSVTRDDLPDGGAEQFARTIRMVRQSCPGAKVEVLVPDFQGSEDSLKRVCDAGPDMFNHNLETVPRLYPEVRPGAVYQRSLEVIAYAAGRGLATKSGLMLGLGESAGEVLQVLLDLRRAGCTCLTLGQYLAPSARHVPVARYVTPGEFEAWADTARAMGFREVASGPLVRSSYRADRMFRDQDQGQCGMISGAGDEVLVGHGVQGQTEGQEASDR